MLMTRFHFIKVRWRLFGSSDVERSLWIVAVGPVDQWISGSGDQWITGDSGRRSLEAASEPAVHSFPDTLGHSYHCSHCYSVFTSRCHSIKAEHSLAPLEHVLTVTKTRLSEAAVGKPPHC